MRPEMLAPNGFLHAATVVGLADTACGYACLAHLPETARSFTTIELKSNFLGTATEGTIRAVAQGVHLGRSTQVWDATVVCARRQDNRAVSLHADGAVLIASAREGDPPARAAEPARRPIGSMLPSPKFRPQAGSSGIKRDQAGSSGLKQTQADSSGLDRHQIASSHTPHSKRRSRAAQRERPIAEQCPARQARRPRTPDIPTRRSPT